MRKIKRYNIMESKLYNRTNRKKLGWALIIFNLLIVLPALYFIPVESLLDGSKIDSIYLQAIKMIGGLLAIAGYSVNTMNKALTKY